MTEAFLTLLRAYIDAQIEYELVRREPGADGYTGGAPAERAAWDAAWRAIIASIQPENE